MIRNLTLISLVSFAGCTGLFTNNGNAYPCNFALPPGERDAPCVDGDVCSINNVCTEFIYEGPRFEGPPHQPDYSALGLQQVHPRVLNAPVTLVARDISRRSGGVFVQTNGFAATISERGQFRSAPTIPADFRSVSLASVQTPMGPKTLAVGISNDRVSYFFNDENDQPVVNTMGPPARRLRARLQLNPNVFLAPTGELDAPQFPSLGGPFVAPPQKAFAVTGTPLDVAVVDRQVAAPAAAVVLTTNGLWLESLDGGFAQLETAPVIDGELNANTTSTVIAASLGRRVLSTWQVGVENGAHSMQRAWPDCTPCRQGLIELVTPLPQSAGLGVEVLCTNPTARTLVRVLGSAAAVTSDACITQTVSAPFDFSRAADATVPLITASSQRGVVIGGKAGEVWAGESLSSVQPVGLERVPLDVTTVSVTLAGTPTQTLIGLTDRYAAVLPPGTPQNQLPSGFRRVDALNELSSDEEVLFSSAIHGTDGWGVLNTGVLARVKLDEDAVGPRTDALRFGRRLVTPSGQPTQRAMGGEAFNFIDGGLAAIYVAADDGLYAVVNPEATLGEASTGAGDVTPQLQPEPSVPIRSLALERTPLGTDGSSRARGYLVTSRNVYEWSLAGTPARWSSRLLQLSGGEPTEVWFDQPRSALGRVGYSDGTIFTLPGGYQLANPLPGGDTGLPSKVIDYENFGGWPVALTTTGLWAAGWEEFDGKVLNRFPDGKPNRPMDWKKLSLSNGTTPWDRGDDTKGRLFVQFMGVDANTANRKFRLYIFLPDRVLLLAEYERK